MRWAWLLGAAFFWLPLAVQAEPLAVAVSAGALGASDPLSAAPSVGLDARWALSPRLGLRGSLDGWTLPGEGTQQARTELTLALGGSAAGRLSPRWSWSVAAAPALTLVDAAGASVAWRPGLRVSPALQLATRRRTLAFELNAVGLLLTDGVRFGAGAGLVYSFL